MIDVQVRIAGSFGDWTSYGNTTWIEAAKAHAQACVLASGSLVEVQDANDDSMPIATFVVKRIVSYEITNPRQGDL